MNANIFINRIICTLLCLIPGYVFSQERAHFDHYMIKDGLSSNRVYSIAQDSLGYIWASTDYGLNRFDGTHVKQFQKKEYPVIARDEILVVQPFGNGVLVGSSNGLLIKYDSDRDDFVNLQPKEFDVSYYKEVRGFYLPPKGKKYAFTVGGIYLYDEKNQSYTSNFKAFDVLSNTHIRSMYVDEYERFWIGTVDCLQIYDKYGRFIRQFDFHQKTRGFVTGIHRINDHQVAVSSFSNELWIFEVEKEKVDNPTVISTPFANVMVMLKDKRGRFWFATDGNGLWYTDAQPKSYSDFKSILPYSASSMDIKKIYAMAEDRNGDIWIGTQSSGIWRYRYGQHSNVIRSSNLGFPDLVCSSFIEDDEGNIFVSSDGNGVYELSPDLKNIKHLKLDKSNVLSLRKGSSGKVWLSTWGDGAYTMDLATREFKKETFKGIDDPVNCFMNVYEMSDGEVWASTAGDGWYVRGKDGVWNRITPIDKNIKFPDIWAVNVAEGKDQTKWFFSTRTLWRQPKGGTPKSLLPDVITIKSHNPLIMVDAICDEKGRLFMTSNEGVFCFEPDGKSHERLDFLPEGTYYTIKQTSDGMFWISGTNGIIMFDYDEETYRVISMDYREKGKSYYYSRSSFLDSKGRLFFGVNDGFVVLDFESISKADSIDYFNFGDLYISRERIHPYDGVLEEGSLSHIKGLELPHKQSDISVTLDVINFSGKGDEECAYRLVGLQDSWIQMGDNRTIKFSYIPPGSYTLEAKVYSLNSNLKEKIISLKIDVLPPWWASWWFKLLVSICIAGLIFMFFRYRLRKLVKTQKFLEEKVDERTIELKRALGDKDRLISVVAHDLKNPMFAIVCALENLKNGKGKLPQEEREKMVGDVLDSAQTLQGEMTKLLDWAKSKRDDIVCHPTDTDVRFVVNNVLLLLRGMMDDKHIAITREMDLTHYAYVDSRMLSTVIRNLLSNAIKFTPTSGSITIKAWEEHDKINIEVADTGVGMDENQLRQVASVGHCESTLGTEKEKGTGLGFAICHDYMLRNNGSMKIFSEKGKGTKILLVIPASSRDIEEQLPQKKIEFEVDRDLFDGNTILVVDDDSLICSGLKSMLQPYVNVLVASNGQEALDLALKNIPDVILSDVEMPVMNGIEMSKRLAENPTTSHIPILFLSARNDEVDRLLGLQSGALDYISKPFSQSELLIKMANILNLRQKQQQHILADAMIQPKATKAVTEEMNPFVKQMLEVIEKSYSDCDLSMETVAKDLCVSQSTLLRRCRSVLGKTPIEVLVEYRLKKAYQMLQKAGANASVSDVAYQVGFNDPSYFTRKFRDLFNILPSQIVDQKDSSAPSE
ncbi:MAG: response regulator [Paludibacteraceae bacterium]|nr:response regulator [Paludibacteraceae bacterium]